MDAVTAQQLDGLSGRLRAFCYHMLGSPFDAEDAVQDVLEKVWRNREQYDGSRASLSTWCLRIARNVCIDRMRETGRRPLPRDLQAAGIDLDAPLVPAIDVPWLQPAPPGWLHRSTVEQVTQDRAEFRFAVTALLQSLPATQRGGYILRELLGLSAAETAIVLGTTVAAVNSGLQRARATIRARTRPGGGVARQRVEQYASAIERGDVGALVSLVSADVILEMPPVPAWSHGVAQYHGFMERLFSWRGTRWATRLVTTGGEPALLLYSVAAGSPVPHTLQLFTADSSGAIDHVLVYRDDRLFALFED